MSAHPPEAAQMSRNIPEKGILQETGGEALRTPLSVSAEIYVLKPPEPEKPGPSDPCAVMPIPAYTFLGRGCA